MSKLAYIQDVLTVFQEAVIEDLSKDGEDLNFKLECSYLADLISADFKYFYGVFKGVSDIYFIPWEDDNMVINTIEELRFLKPDILTVELHEEDYIKIYSNCKNTFDGGNLYIAATALKIFDQDFRELNLDELSELSDKYWYQNNKAEG